MTQPLKRFVLFPLVTFIFITICISACEPAGEQKTDDGTLNAETAALDTCGCSELISDSTTQIYTLNGSPYTGICISYYPGSTDKYIEENFFDGKLHGKVTYYDRTGEILLEELYDNGTQKRSGNNESLVCKCTELEFTKTTDPQYPSVAQLDEIPFTGKCEEKYPDSEQPSMESNYKNGILHGYTIYYNRDGSTILIEHYDMGELVSAVN